MRGAPIGKVRYDDVKAAVAKVIGFSRERGSHLGPRNGHSVPVRVIGCRARAVLHANELVVHDGTTEMVRHERLIAKGGE